MTDLTIRQIDFDIDETDFIWNPANPAFSVLMNQITFFVVGFEKYMCRVIRDAEPQIKTCLSSSFHRKQRLTLGLSLISADLRLS